MFRTPRRAEPVRELAGEIPEDDGEHSTHSEEAFGPIFVAPRPVAGAEQPTERPAEQPDPPKRPAELAESAESPQQPAEPMVT